MSVKKPVVDFIANQLAPSDLVGVMYPLTPIDAAVLTRNHQGVINTVEKFRAASTTTSRSTTSSAATSTS